MILIVSIVSEVMSTMIRFLVSQLSRVVSWRFVIISEAFFFAKTRYTNAKVLEPNRRGLRIGIVVRNTK